MLAQPRGAYVVYGLEPGLDFADQAVALKALGGAQVVAFSQFACSSTRAVADVILPIGALPEIDATLTNLDGRDQRSEEHTSELQSLMRISYAVFCLKKKKTQTKYKDEYH